MKMKFWDRIILRIGAVLTFLGGVLTAVCGAMIYGMNLGEGIVMQSIPLTLICAGVVIALISLYNLLMPRRYHNGRHAFVVQPTEMGELRIAVSAIENLILKCVETHKEVKVQDIAITNRRGAVSVQLRVTMDSNVSIPHAVEQIQTQVKRYLAASSGIEVRDISVSVDRTEGEARPVPMESLVLNNEEPAAEQEAKKEKVPMHQRIFGRDTTKTEAEQVMEAEEITPPEEREKPAEEVAEPAQEPAGQEAEKEAEEHE